MCISDEIVTLQNPKTASGSALDLMLQASDYDETETIAAITELSRFTQADMPLEFKNG